MKAAFGKEQHLSLGQKGEWGARGTFSGMEKSLMSSMSPIF